MKQTNMLQNKIFIKIILHVRKNTLTQIKTFLTSLPQKEKHQTTTFRHIYLKVIKVLERYTSDSKQ